MTELRVSEYPVLFVDDDRAMLQSTAQWLSLSGCKVRSFAEPAALLRCVKPGMDCVVVSDIRMPDMDGMQLLRAVQTRDPKIPVILITGHGDVPLAVGAMKAGAFDFFTKPFSPEALLECVKRAGKSIHDEACQVQTAGVSCHDVNPAPNPATDDGSLPTRLEQYEKTMIMDSLLRHDGRIPEVLSELQIPRRTLNEKMRKYGILRKDFRN